MEKKEKNNSWKPVTILLGMLLIFIVIRIPLIQKESNEQQELYEEWCPKLGSELLQPREGYYYTPRCIIEEDGIVKLYWIANINGEYKLREHIPSR